MTGTLQNMGPPASCPPAGGRLGQLTLVTSFPKVLPRCQISLPFPQDSLDRAAAALASRKAGFSGKSPGNGCIPELQKVSLSLPTAA